METTRTPAQRRPAILCVDDEPELLAGLGLHLRRHYTLSTATSGAQGLQLLTEQGPYAVVMSDMRMPGMNGAEFLAAVRQRAPETVRMLLTGHADMESAISAVNEGQIFRFLTKPCPPASVLAAFEAAHRQYQLVTAEKVLLEQTLHGSIQALSAVLALSNPVVFGRASRIKKSAAALVRALGLADAWQIEVAAMLSPLGTIILPAETLEKHLAGQPLTVDEQAMVERMPAVVEDLLAHIPRLEEVRAILADLSLARAGKLEVCEGAAVLAIAADFDDLESRGQSAPRALDALQERARFYRPELLARFVQVQRAAQAGKVRQIEVSGLKVGQVLAQEVRSTGGVLLVARGFEITPGVVERLKNFRGGSIAQPLHVIDPGWGES
ncbi:MAG: HD domain-containing phosphohydrolase [Pseudomonadota bacterium]